MFRDKPSASAYDRIAEAVSDIGDRIAHLEEQVAERVNPTPSAATRAKDAVARHLPMMQPSRRSYVPGFLSNLSMPSMPDTSGALHDIKHQLAELRHSVSDVSLPRLPALRRRHQVRGRLDYMRDNPSVSMLVVAGGALVAVGAAYYLTKKLAEHTEEPDYQVVRQDGDIEIRDYDAMVVAETVKTGYHEKALRSGFDTLYNYIRAQNRSGKKIAMTTPVLQQLSESEGRTKGWAVRFVMPKKFSASTLPKPVNEDVAIKEFPARRVVAIRFPGTFTASLASKKLMTLYNYLSDENLSQKGDPEYAFYNPPWTPGFMRRNEILIEIER
ncbi:SOUL family heme-binding protein [Consotaella salsifontis]|uniref:SOUL heme-binding protein n=1 Tax=Consotaella salsifontis TaxID=1365950 RepID=A0A1T4RC36_9HYPH|nr:heme-binding protein [Consotaella salsifontis]SKA13622.1 SOUL heme-binding protein [Consotaella salsifontis]